jgi:hypothetical protein
MEQAAVFILSSMQLQLSVQSVEPAPEEEEELLYKAGTAGVAAGCAGGVTAGGSGTPGAGYVGGYVGGADADASAVGLASEASSVASAPISGGSDPKAIATLIWMDSGPVTGMLSAKQVSVVRCSLRPPPPRARAHTPLPTLQRPQWHGALQLPPIATRSSSIMLVVQLFDRRGVLACGCLRLLLDRMPACLKPV